MIDQLSFSRSADNAAEEIGEQLKEWPELRRAWRALSADGRDTIRAEWANIISRNMQSVNDRALTHPDSEKD